MESNKYIDFEKFSKREVKAKDIFYIKQISKQSAYNFIRTYHYLGDAKFFSVYQFGLFYKPTTELVGAATFSLPQGIVALESWFNLSNDTKNIFELSRLCMLPRLNKTNASSYLLGGAIKELHRMNEEVKRAKHKNKEEMTAEDFVCRAVITLADASRHAGSIYQVCNFKYYGVTSPKVDFYREDGLKNPRGGPSQWHGAYLLRTHKHRYAYILDDTLKCCYQEMPKPSANALIEKTCCGGTHILYDNRFKEYWTCPICTGKLELVDKDGNKLENPRLQGVTVKEKDKENDNFTKFSWDL